MGIHPRIVLNCKVSKRQRWTPFGKMKRDAAIILSCHRHPYILHVPNQLLFSLWCPTWPKLHILHLVERPMTSLKRYSLRAGRRYRAYVRRQQFHAPAFTCGRSIKRTDIADGDPTCFSWALTFWRYLCKDQLPWFFLLKFTPGYVDCLPVSSIWCSVIVSRLMMGMFRSGEYYLWIWLGCYCWRATRCWFYCE